MRTFAIVLPSMAAAASGASGVAAVGGSGFSDTASPIIYPLSSPTPEQWFTPLKGRLPTETRQPTVLTNTTWDEVVYHLHRGQPTVVADAARSWPYLGWTCEQFANAYPSASMKAEYTDDQERVSTGNHDWINKPRKNDGGAGRRLTAADREAPKPKHAPYIWHVKDEETPELKRRIQGKFRAPYFFQDPLNVAFANNSFEFWLSPGGQAGSFAHNDGYCESVISTQLNGAKRWRMMLMPEMKTVFDSFDEFDAGVYRSHHAWQPELDFDNPQGGAIIFPPGYMHESMAHGQCSTSTTYQYKFPQPTKYIRTFLPRLLMSQEVGKCSQTWDPYATWQNAGEVVPTLDKKAVRAQLERILKLVDADGDRSITLAEAKRYYNEAAGMAWARQVHIPFDFRTDEVWAQVDKGAAQRALADARALDAVAYHDTDDDAAVSEAELWEALYSWNVVRRVVVERARILTKGADKAELVAFERALNVFRRPDAGDGVGGQFSGEIDVAGVRPELQKILARGRKKGPLPSISSSAAVDENFWSSGGEQEGTWGPPIADRGVMAQLGAAEAPQIGDGSAEAAEEEEEPVEEPDSRDSVEGDDEYAYDQEEERREEL